MIWCHGRLDPDDRVSLSINDRALRHGIGLFETLRTWHGRPLLLQRHLRRLVHSARTLGFPLDEAALPDENAVRQLLAASSDLPADAMLRISLSGGTPDHERSCRVWMTAQPLPVAPPPAEGLRISTTARLEVARTDPLTRHKILAYWPRQRVMDEARAQGADEALAWTSEGRVWEAMASSLFVIRDGTLLTPPLSGPVLPGVMRSVVIERAADLKKTVHEVELVLSDLEHADGLFLTNAVRAIRRVSQVGEHSMPPRQPGDVIDQLDGTLQGWLHAGGDLG
jgi:branched-subunit amino acid aminotransferase/4-amino-4-deoxychorismate lyase